MALVKYNNNSLSAITTTAGMPAGAMTLIKEQTASSSSTISFVDGTSDVVLDSTYPIYLFKFINLHPASDNAQLFVNFSVDTGSNYNVTKTTSVFNATGSEDGTLGALGYSSGSDLAQGTGTAVLTGDSTVGNGNDECLSGYMYLFGPSSTTFVKHFMVTVNFYELRNRSYEIFTAGYGNTTSAIDAIQFSMSSNIDTGTIKLYGIKDS